MQSVNKMSSKAKWVITAALIILVVCSASYAILQSQPSAPQPTEKDVLFQLAAFNTFSTGKYAGLMTYADLEKHGDFGIGTFDGLDGEMIALDGMFYQVPSSGIPQEATQDQTAPYATITYFTAEQTYTVTSLTYTELRSFLDGHISDEAIYAIKVHGSYSTAETRSPEKQLEPYPNINDALATQHIFNLTDVSASAVGFYFPSSMDGVDYAGYHLHLITDDHTAGGHLLDCQIANATIEVDKINNYNLILPP